MIWLLALAFAQDGSDTRQSKLTHEFRGCMKQLEGGADWVRNATGCAAYAHDRVQGAEAETWSVQMARTRLEEHLPDLVRYVERSTEDCPGIGARRRFPMSSFQICQMLAGFRDVTVHDERDLVTAATSAVDLAVLRHTTSVVMELGEQPTVIEHNYASGLARYRISVRSPDQRVCLTARDRWLAHVERVELEETEDQERVWTLDFAFLQCIPEPGAAEGDRCQCPSDGE